LEAGRRKGMDKYKRWDRNAKEKRINYTRMKGVKDRNVGENRGKLCTRVCERLLFKFPKGVA